MEQDQAGVMRSGLRSLHGAEIRMNSVKSMGSVKGYIYIFSHSETGGRSDSGAWRFNWLQRSAAVYFS